MLVVPSLEKYLHLVPGSTISRPPARSPAPPAPKRSDSYGKIDGDIVAMMRQQGRAMSRTEIAAAMGLAKSPWLNRHLEKLVAGGGLRRFDTLSARGSKMFMYELTE
jgi:hypothetical protein